MFIPWLFSSLISPPWSYCPLLAATHCHAHIREFYLYCNLSRSVSRTVPIYPTHHLPIFFFFFFQFFSLKNLFACQNVYEFCHMRNGMSFFLSHYCLHKTVKIVAVTCNPSNTIRFINLQSQHFSLSFTLFKLCFSPRLDSRDNHYCHTLVYTLISLAPLVLWHTHLVTINSNQL